MTQDQTLPTRADFRYWWPVTVRWGDMDALGHVNNMIYLQYLESARVGFFEALGWPIPAGVATGFAPVVVSQTFNYRLQLAYPAELEVGVRSAEIRTRSFVLAYAIYRRGTETLVGDGSSVLAWLDAAAGKAVDIPPALREALTAP